MTAKSFHLAPWVSRQGSTRFSAALSHQTTGATASNEVRAQVEMDVAGTIRKMSMYIASVNSSTRTSTHRVRVNGSNGNSVLLCNGFTGRYTDLVNQDVVAVGDLVSISGTGNGAVWSITSNAPIIFEFEADTGSKPKMMYGCSTIIFGIANGYFPWGRTASQFSSNESTYNQRPPKFYGEGTLTRFRTYIEINTKTFDCTFTIRKNFVDTSMAFVVPAGVTGWFEDITNSVTIVAGDELNIHGVNAGGTGSGSLSATFMSMLFEPDGNEFDISTGFSSASNQGNTAVPTFYSCGHTHFTGSTEDDRTARIPFDCRAKNLRVYVTHAGAISGVMRLRVNNADTSLAVALSAASSNSGWYEDLTGYADLSEGDSICYQLDAGYSSPLATNWGVIGMTIDNDPNFVPPSEGALLFFFQ